jgi:hypothetical protein
MNTYHDLGRNPFMAANRGLNRENLSDHKVTMVNTIDMTSAVRLRRTAAEKPSYTALVARALALALRRHPEANRLIIPGLFGPRLVQLETVDISVAVERDQPGREQAAYAATMRDVDTLDPGAITRQLVDFAGTRDPRWHTYQTIVERLPYWLAAVVLSMPRYSPAVWIRHRGGAALISSPAKYGVDTMLAAWPWPLGVSFGLIKERPWAENGQLSVRPTMDLTFSFNRCIIAGAPAARLMATLSSLLTDAENTLYPSVPATEMPLLKRA